MDKLDTHKILALVIIVGFFAAYFFPAKDDTFNETIKAVILIVIGYFFGSSSGSRHKTDLLDKK